MRPNPLTDALACWRKRSAGRARRWSCPTQLAAQAEIEKWWPIHKAANIKGE